MVRVKGGGVGWGKSGGAEKGPVGSNEGWRIIITSSCTALTS